MINVALAMPSGSLRNAALYALHELKANVEYDHENATDWSGLADALAGTKAAALLFDLNSLPESDLAGALQKVKAYAPQMKLIAAYPYDDPSKILAAMRAGANEFVHAPVGPALASAFERIEQAPALPVAAAVPTPERHGKLIGFVSAKGGCGATTIACHVAADLKRTTGKEILLAELDTSAGPLSFVMKTQGQYTSADVLDNINRLDANFWSAVITRSRTGVDVLPAHAKSAGADPEKIARAVRFMRTQHDWTILDFGRGVNPLLSAVAEELDELLVVTTVDIPSLHIAKTMLRTLPGAFEKVTVRLVLNRTQKALEVSSDEIQKIFQRPVHLAIPDDFAGLYEASANGTLLSHESPLGGCFASLARQLTGEMIQPKTKKFRFW